MRLVSSRMTAAATTGPASGPRPASSTPATRPGRSQPRLRSICSGREDFFDRIGGGGSGVAAQFEMESVETLAELGAGQRVAEPAKCRTGERVWGGIAL